MSPLTHLFSCNSVKSQTRGYVSAVKFKIVKIVSDKPYKIGVKLHTVLANSSSQIKEALFCKVFPINYRNICNNPHVDNRII